ncbi:M1 family metallopeptidase [Lolliginicoccus suaedae]|uniref:M1 family metallopeptidase n=1 Tax=Lolliginicoccus suaedae TaxID=2605429 RepID=UPI0011EFCE39|nr:M1 family metallopeptidase [Lolliginicoccus suaedae]
MNGKSRNVLDPYLPASGNTGYQVSRYDLALSYRVTTNRLDGHALVTATATEDLTALALDLGSALKVTKVKVNDSGGIKFSQRDNKLRIKLSGTIRRGDLIRIDVRYAGHPRPLDNMFGSIGWEELTEGALTANQPNGACTWFPCNDHPSAKASYRITITTESTYQALANGTLVSRKSGAGTTTWVYDQPEPMSPYLATVQIGRYATHTVAATPVLIKAAVPPALRRRFDHDFARQRDMMTTFISMFGPYPFPSYTVVVTEDELEIPLEAQCLSIFGANHCDGSRDSERLIAHELAHQWFGNSVTAAQYNDIWLHEGFACYAEWLWSERSDGPSAKEWAEHYWTKLDRSPKDLVLTDPGPRNLFDDRVYKRGALALHSLRCRIGDDAFFSLLQDWTTRHRFGTVTTQNFTDLASNYTRHDLGGLWNEWLTRRPLPDLP